MFELFTDFLDIPFWKKMFAITFIAGYAMFVIYLIRFGRTIANSTAQFKAFKARCIKAYRDDTIRRKRLIEDIKKRIHGKALVYLLLAFIMLSLIGISERVSAVNPTLTNGNYDKYPRADAGVSLSFWVTYTDADNDAPNYVRVYYGTAFKAMQKNDSLDTNYTNGCNYSVTWDYFPYIGFTILMSFRTISNSSPVIQAPFYASVIPFPFAEHECLSYNKTAGEHTFSTTVFQPFDYAVNVWLELDGTFYLMDENDSEDIYYYNGKEFHESIELSKGLHTYRFWYDDTPYVIGLPQYSVGWGNVSFGTHWVYLIEYEYTAWAVFGITCSLLAVSLTFAFWRGKSDGKA